MRLYDYIANRLNCCFPIVGCGCSIVIVLPTLLGTGAVTAYLALT